MRASRLAAERSGAALALGLLSATLVVLVAGFLAPVGLGSGWAAPSAGGPVAGPSATISVTLYSDQLDWFGPPGTLVNATALNDGVAVASAYQAVADDAGRARLRFSNVAVAPNTFRPGSTIQPTDDLVVMAAGYAPITVTLPAVAGNRIRGLLAAPRVDIEVGQPVACVNVRDDRCNVEVRDADDQIRYTGCAQPRGEPVLAGDLVTLEMGPGFLVPGTAPTSSLRVPAFSASFDLAVGTLRGAGPPGQWIEVDLTSPFRASAQHVVRTDAAGLFSLPMPGDPATAATLRFEAENGFTVRQT